MAADQWPAHSQVQILPSAPQSSHSEITLKREKSTRTNRIRILLIAVSPPSSGGYFYFPITIGKDHLFRETMKALGLWPAVTPMRKGLDKRPLLEEFRTKGFFLIDTCQSPVDKLDSKERKHEILRDASGLARRAEGLHPHHIIVIKKTVYQPVREALEWKGLGEKILNNKPLKFPSYGNQRDYRSSLRRLSGKYPSVWRGPILQ